MFIESVDHYIQLHGAELFLRS